MLYKEYDLDKLWRDTSRIQIRNCMDFADTDLEVSKAKFKDWYDDQQKIRLWKQLIDR